MSNLTEMSALALDVRNFFRSYGHILHSSPLFVQVFDLNDNDQSTVERKSPILETKIENESEMQQQQSPFTSLYDLEMLTDFDIF